MEAANILFASRPRCHARNRSGGCDHPGSKWGPLERGIRLTEFVRCGTPHVDKSIPMMIVVEGHGRTRVDYATAACARYCIRSRRVHLRVPCVIFIVSSFAETLHLWKWKNAIDSLSGYAAHLRWSPP